MFKIKKPSVFIWMPVLLIILAVMVPGCEEPLFDSPGNVKNLSNTISWTEYLPEIIPSGEVSFVSNGESISKAILSAEAGESIYIEPGIYNERLVISRNDIALIGLTDPSGHQVIMQDQAGTLLPIENSGDVPVYNIVRQGEWKSTGTSSLKRGYGNQYKRNLISMHREDLGAQVAHYTFDIKVGPDPYDEVRIHRVVKERKPYHPIKTNGEIFMIHGSGQDFDDIFLTAGNLVLNESNSIPVYLAMQGKDAWGIDLGWTRIPVEESDFGFLKDWGVGKDRDNTLAAMSIARIIRAMTGGGLTKMNLLGFSYGAAVAYSAAAFETRQHMNCRDIKGLIPVDQPFKLSDEESRAQTCINAQGAMESINSGNYVNPQGVGMIALGQLALDAPDELSPIPDFQALGLTNSQVTIFIGANTYFNGQTPTPSWHFLAGNGPEAFIPASDFLYTDKLRWNRLLAGLSPYQPVKMSYDMLACLCDEGGTDIDAHFTDIRVPVYYIGANGGTGAVGLYTLELLSSTDIQTNLVQLSNSAYNDFGHGDLFLAGNAPSEVWQPLNEWLEAN